MEEKNSKNLKDDKSKALKAAMDQIEKQYGKGSIMRMGDTTITDVDTIPTGSISLDIALGIGGLPCGRIVEIFGPESSGKLDPIYASKIGVKVDDLLVSQPDTGEQALEICDMLVRSGAVDVVIVDSVAALTPKAEIEGEMGESHMGLQARLMSQALRKLTANIKNANCLCVFINQIRMKIGIAFGNPETTTGGQALKFYSSVRLDIRRTGTVKNGNEVIGSETRVKVVKNKMAAPFKQAEFNIIYNEGISKESEIIDLGVKCGIIQKSGAWFAYNGEKIGQGKVNAANYLKENEAVSSEIEKLIREQLMHSDKYEGDIGGYDDSENQVDADIPPMEDEPF